MPRYHAYEIASDGALDIRVDLDPEDNKRRFDADVEALKGEDYSYRTGTVEAEDPAAAMNKIRAGEWDFTEVC